MSKKRKKKLTKREQKKKRDQHFILIGILMIFLCVIGLLKLGFIGRLIVNFVTFFVGNSYWIFLILSICIGGLYLLHKDYLIKKMPVKIIGVSIFYLGILLLFSLNFENYQKSNMFISVIKAFKDGYSNLGGGIIGSLFYEGIEFLFSRVGVYIFSFVFMLIGGMITFNISVDKLFKSISKLVQSVVKGIGHAKNSLSEQMDNFEINQKDKQVVNDLEEEKVEPEFMETYEPVSNDNNKLSKVIDPVISSEKNPTSIVEEKLDIEEPNISDDVMFNQDDNPNYQLPPITLLNSIKPTDQSNEKRSVEYKKKILAKTFDSFGVDAKVEDYHVGPSITKFEIKLAVGVKVSKIINLADDLALALAAKDVRIEAPIPGKSLIGIEVPNQNTSMVSFREVMEEKPKLNKNLLDVPLGKDITGQVIMADISKMPHLLIAGSTGSGKSVCINGIITSLLMQAKPNEVKLMMIDPKMVELSVYNGIPHLLTPVVTNPRKASQALHKMVEEMERRYELFAQAGVRNMSGYNEYVKHQDNANLDLLPYIVVIVDELADLMMVASREVEDAITRLAQMARAAGIHMILATQRPSVDVITGLIKANVPSRIAFAVSSGTDSRTILDSNGAEKLLGRGDMLFIPIGENKPIRVQGAFISDQEVEKIVNYITEQQGPDYQENMEPTEEVTDNSNDNQVPSRFDEAVELVVLEQKASASLIQRRLHIGYNAAANIIDEMENRGIIGPPNGSKPREVYLKSSDNN